MKEKIFHNAGLKFASLLLAILLWFLVALIDDPQETVTFYNIPVRLTNTELLEQQNKVYEVLDNSSIVTVKVRAPKSVAQKLRASDIMAVADVNKLTEINTIAIAYTIQNNEVESVKSIKGDHDMVALTVEERQSKSIRVQYTTTGTPAEGYKVIESGLDQTMIKVSGPKSAIERISYAGVSMNVDGATSQMSMNIEPVLYDYNNNPLELTNVTRNVTHVLMTVKILAVKEVEIQYSYMGEPADGYLTTGETSCSPQTLLVASNPSTLASFDKIEIPAEQLDITGLTETLIKVINIKDYLDSRNVRLANSDYKGDISIRIYIEPKVEKTCEIETASLSLLRIPEGYTVEFVDHDQPYQLKLAGLNNVVSELQNNIRGTIDFGAWMRDKGITELEDEVYHVPVTFQLEDHVDQLNEVNILVRFVKNE